MNFVRKLIGNALPAGLDFCAGAFITCLVFRIFGKELSFLDLVIGGLLALLPDIDLPSQFMRKDGEEVDHHRSPFHYPLLMVPIVGLISAFAGGAAWGMIAATCLLFHYAHDMTGPYGGLFLLWPLSRSSYGVNGIEEMGQSKRELYIRETGHEAWISRYWMRPSNLSIPELALGTIFAGGTWLLYRDGWWVLVLSIGSWAGLALCTITNPRMK